MSVKFGLYAKFHGGSDADISFYPDIICNKIDTNLTALEVDPDTNYRRIIENTAVNYPTTFPQAYPDSFELVLPEYFRDSVVPYTAKASVIIKQHDGNMVLINGVKPKKNDPPPPVPEYKNDINLLFVADGFDGSSGSDVERFKKYVTQIRTQMLKPISTPWNLLNNINFWAYFLKSNEPMGSERGQYLSIGSTSSVNRMIPLQHYVKICDKVIKELSNTMNNAIANGPPITLENYIDDRSKLYGNEIVSFLGLSVFNNQSVFPVINPAEASQNKPHILNLSQLCSIVGLPSMYDDGKTLSQKRSDWTTLGLLPSPDYDLIFPGDAPNQSDKYYVTDFLFSLWKQLKDQRLIEIADTYLGLERYYESRNGGNPEWFLSYVKYELGDSKFASYVDFNKLISHYTYTDSASQNHEIGKEFFENNGDPVFSIYDIIDNTDNPQIIYKNIKNGNNVIILSKLYKLGLDGLNAIYPETILENNAKIVYTLHRSIIPIMNKVAHFTPCSIIPENTNLERPEIYKPNPTSISELSFLVKNTVIHELSHNFLLDEYTDRDTNFMNESSSIKEKENEFFSNSNIQTLTTLLSGTQLDASRIKWLWPRIKKIGIGKTDLKEHQSNYVAELITGSSSFEVGEFVLLRTRRLFNAKYILFKILAIDSGNPNKLTIKNESTETVDLYDFCLGFIMILPRWIDEHHTDYERLVHNLIKQRMDALHAPLVDVDEFIGTYKRQTPEKNDNIPGMSEDPIANMKNKNKSNIVGLYAGARGIYGGYSEGVYHPTGFCIMRNTDDEEIKPYGFCHVCRYIMADAMNPLIHPLIDAFYDTIYKRI